MEISIEQFNQMVQKIEAIDYLLNGHTHSGIDAKRVLYADIAEKRLYYHWTIPGSAASSSGNYGVFFIARFPCYISALLEVHQTAGTDGGAVTLDLEKLTGTQAPGAGVTALSASLSLKATANTVQTASFTNNLLNRNLAMNDRLALKPSGVLTSVANVTIGLEITLA